MLIVQHTLIALKLNISQKKFKIHRQQKYHNKYRIKVNDWICSKCGNENEKKKNCKGTFSGLRPEKMLFISS